MKARTSFIAISLCLFFAGGAIALSAVVQQEQEKRQVVRVKRPTFNKRDWDGIFFENLFAEGLKGDRPTDLGAANDDSVASTNNTTNNAQNPADSGNGSGTWSEIIDGSVIEDEVKRIQMALNEQVTTPTKYETQHNQVRQSFAMLSMLFAIIREYDGDVRWKEHAPAAQKAFAQAAANARTSSQQSYAYAKRRREDLAELIRGGPFPESAENEPIKDWSSIVDRIPIMERLEESTAEKLRPMTSSDKEITENIEVILHEASLVAAMGRVLAAPGMLDADDDDYMELALAMGRLGSEIKSSVQINDLSSIADKATLINQSCDDCHNEWR